MQAEADFHLDKGQRTQMTALTSRQCPQEILNDACRCLAVDQPQLMQVVWWGQKQDGPECLQGLLPEYVSLVDELLEVLLLEQGIEEGRAHRVRDLAVIQDHADQLVVPCPCERRRQAIDLALLQSVVSQNQRVLLDLRHKGQH